MLQRIDLQKLSDESPKESLESLSLRIADVEHVNDILPFYTKGPVIMMMLDIELRHQTQNRFSMDKLLLRLNDAYGKTRKSFPDDSLVSIISEISGADITDFYHKYISGTDSLPLTAFFEKAGLVLKHTDHMKPDVGYLILPDTSGQFFIAHVAKGSSAEKIGLKEGDILLAINDVGSEDGELFMQSVSAPIPQIGTGLITFTVKRQDKILSLSGTVAQKVKSEEVLMFNPNATQEEIAIRSGIFSMPNQQK
jgi:predicted metalloprotease with PDZ domain